MERSRSPSRSPRTQRRMFFGDDYVESEHEYPTKEEFHAEVIKPSAEYIRTQTTTTTTTTVVCEEQMHMESDMETNTSSIADNTWEISPVRRRSTADSTPSDFSPSPFERKNTRTTRERPSYSGALAVSSGMSDALARMKMRKQEMEMASVVDKVQKQMLAMEIVLKELQLEHRLKCDLLERQIEVTKKVEEEKLALQVQLDQVTRQLLAEQAHKENETARNVNYMSVAMNSFMSQSEHTQHMIMEQLKSMAQPGVQVPHQSFNNSNQSVHAFMSQLAEYHHDVLNAVKSVQSAPADDGVKTAPAALRRSITLDETSMASSPPKKVMSTEPQSTFFTSARAAMLGATIFAVGLGAGQFAHTKDVQQPIVHQQHSLDMDVLVEKIKQMQKEVQPIVPSKWVEVAAPVKEVAIVEPIVDATEPVQALAPSSVVEVKSEVVVPTVHAPIVSEPITPVEVEVEAAKGSIVEVVEQKPVVSSKSDVNAHIALLLDMQKSKSIEPKTVVNPLESFLAMKAKAEPAKVIDEVKSETFEETVEEATDFNSTVGMQPTLAKDVVLVELDSTAVVVTDHFAVGNMSNELPIVQEITETVAIEVPLLNATESETHEVETSIEEPIEVVDTLVEVDENVVAPAEELESTEDEVDVVKDDVEIDAFPTDAEPKSTFDTLAVALRALVAPASQQVVKSPSAPKMEATKITARHLWKRNDVATLKTLETVELVVAKAAEVAVEVDTINVEVNVTETLEIPPEEAVVAEVFVNDESSVWLSPSKPWAEEVYANMTSEVDIASVDAEMPVVPAKLIKFAFDLPKCHANASLVSEARVTLNPFYVAKAEASAELHEQVLEEPTVLSVAPVEDQQEAAVEGSAQTEVVANVIAEAQPAVVDTSPETDIDVNEESQSDSEVALEVVTDFSMQVVAVQTDSEPAVEVSEPLVEAIEVVETIDETVEATVEVVEPIHEVIEESFDVIEPTLAADVVSEVLNPVEEVVEPVVEAIEPIANVAEVVETFVEDIDAVVDLTEVAEPTADVIEVIDHVVVEPISEAAVEEAEPLFEDVEPVSAHIESGVEEAEPVVEVTEPIEAVVEPIVEEPEVAIVESTADSTEDALEVSVDEKVEPTVDANEKITEELVDAGLPTDVIAALPAPEDVASAVELVPEHVEAVADVVVEEPAAIEDVAGAQSPVAVNPFFASN
ncbi:Aste57867_21335 [Aphanomyces stellatus]|uniref:Aste57867_21335 protein n=1 Tax=Aphanomyces stellatus TaxID=120398 RepID=A0A485LIJ0_9STRA|nr:hypothetical protein As57867_021266 [Aphanomyces stellatus]VFT98007.1 Aste57867_21335 [Aphanomyces stellatus]